MHHLPRPLNEVGGAKHVEAAAGKGYADDLYDDIQSSIGYRTEPRDVTPYVVALALLLGLAAAGLSMRWFARLP